MVQEHVEDIHEHAVFLEPVEFLLGGDVVGDEGLRDEHADGQLSDACLLQASLGAWLGQLREDIQSILDEFGTDKHYDGGGGRRDRVDLCYLDQDKAQRTHNHHS